MPHLDPDQTVAELLRREPWALEVLLGLGFKPLANPVTRKVMSHLVTLRQACERNDRALTDVLDALRAAAPPAAPGVAVDAAIGTAPETTPETTAEPEAGSEAIAAPKEADR